MLPQFRNASWMLIALLLALAAATVLITPDPTDDLAGVVRSRWPLIATLRFSAPAKPILHLLTNSHELHFADFFNDTALTQIYTCRC